MPDFTHESRMSWRSAGRPALAPLAGDCAASQIATHLGVPLCGPANCHSLDEPIAVSLKEPVPTDHFSRHLQAKLDLGFIRDRSRGLYADCGCPGIDAVVFFKL